VSIDDTIILGDRLLPPGDSLWFLFVICFEFATFGDRFRRALRTLALWLLNDNAAREPLLYQPESLAAGLFYFARGPAPKSLRRHEGFEF